MVLKFRTFPDGVRGVFCESSDVRTFLKKSKFQNFSELFKVKGDDQAPIVSAGEFLKLPFVTDDE